MNIHCEGAIYDPSGAPIKVVTQTVYLGGLISCTSAARPEVTRRLGEAIGGFKALSQCWSHANINRNRKAQIYVSCIVSKLLYNLDSLWLLQADLQRIDAFHVKCLRRIYGIPCSYISRVSNQEVLRVSLQEPLSRVLRERQRKLYLDIVAFPEDHLLRKLTCEPLSTSPKVWQLARKRGRPKQQWAHCVYAELH